MIYQHGGNITTWARMAQCDESEICDFSANINPLGPPRWIESVIEKNVDRIASYPDPYSEKLVYAIAEKLQVDQNKILVGNGATEIIYSLPMALEHSSAIIPVPSYMDYFLACKRGNLKINLVSPDSSNQLDLDWSRLEASIHGDEIIFLGHPNNPTGHLLDFLKLTRLIERFPQVTFVIDESFIDFVESNSSLLMTRSKNMILIRSMTKIYAIPGIRLGYVIAESDDIERIKAFLPSWSVNVFACEIGIHAINDDKYLDRSRYEVARQREKLCRQLSQIHGFKVFKGCANFLLIKMDIPGLTASGLRDSLIQREKIAIRVCDNFHGLNNNYFRVAVKSDVDNARLVISIRKILSTTKMTKEMSGEKQGRE